MKLVIPTKLSEITLSQFRRYQKVVSDNPDDDTFVCINMVSIFCNISVADVMKIPYQDFAEIVETIARTLDEDSDFVRTFKMNGVSYGFIPNFEKITLDEQASIDTCLSDDSLTETMLSIMYRPITKKANIFYEIKPYDKDVDNSELFKDVPMNIARGAKVFFYRLMKDLLNNTLSSIPTMAKREGLNLEEVLQNAGGGITTLSHLQENIDAMSKMLEKEIFTAHSRFYHI